MKKKPHTQINADSPKLEKIRELEKKDILSKKNLENKKGEFQHTPEKIVTHWYMLPENDSITLLSPIHTKRKRK